MSNNTQHFEELELVAEKAGELNDRVGKIESELGAQTKTLESAALVLDAAIKGLGALKSSVLENDIGALQLALNDKTAHLSREIARFETAVAEIDRRAEAGDEQLAASLRDTALGLREAFNAKNAELSEWSARVEREIAAHSVALAAIPPVIKGADAKPFNPRGEWQAGMIVNSLDVVSYNGSSYISNEDGNTEKPTRSAKYTTLAKRSGNGAGGATDFAGITGSITPAQIVPGETTFAVGDVLYAGTTGTLSKLGAGTSGQLFSTQGVGVPPIWVTATGGAGDFNGPASATDNAIVRFDGTGGKTGQNSAVTVADTTGAMTFGDTGSFVSIAGTSAAAAVNQGVLRSANFGISGNSGGASYFGGEVNSATRLQTGTLTATPSATPPIISGGGTFVNSSVITTIAGVKVRAYDNNTSVHGLGASLDGLQYFAGLLADHIWTTDNNGSEKMRLKYSTGHLLLGTTSTTGLAGSAGMKITSTTSAATSTEGSLIVGNMSTATSVAIGGGNINAGGTITAAGAIAIGNTVNVVSPTSPNRTITIVVGGVTLYIAAKTTND